MGANHKGTWGGRVPTTIWSGELQCKLSSRVSRNASRTGHGGQVPTTIWSGGLQCKCHSEFTKACHYKQKIIYVVGRAYLQTLSQFDPTLPRTKPSGSASLYPELQPDLHTHTPFERSFFKCYWVDRLSRLLPSGNDVQNINNFTPRSARLVLRRMGDQIKSNQTLIKVDRLQPDQ